jgi:hypothetical protein
MLIYYAWLYCRQGGYVLILRLSQSQQKNSHYSKQFLHILKIGILFKILTKSFSETVKSNYSIFASFNFKTIFFSIKICRQEFFRTSNLIITVCVFVCHVFLYHQFYFDFHSARIIFDVSSGFYKFMERKQDYNVTSVKNVKVCF